VKLSLRPYILSETFIPEDVFGTKRILDIWIEFSPVFVDRSLSLQVDTDAFRSTKSYTEKLTITYIDCTLLDLSFLSGFDKLTHLNLWNINNIQICLPRLPPLPKLNRLEFKYATGMNHLLNIYPTLTNGLKVFWFYGWRPDNDKTYNDETIDHIMDWLLLSSANTLEEMLIIDMNQMTRVPHKVASFKALKKLLLYDNNISTIKSGELSFSVPVSLMSIYGNGIEEIEPGAFQGKHDCSIYIYR